METKLELAITLENSKYKYYPSTQKLYLLKIKIVKKDDRFDDYMYRGNIVYYSALNKISILSHWTYKKGFFNEDQLYLPSKDNLNEIISYTFFTDEKRKEFLKRLYNSLEEWSKNWFQFRYDFDNKFEVMNNVWKISFTRNYFNNYV
jgi:hypothetical protein